MLMAEYGAMPFSEANRRAISAASKAVALDDSLPEAHASLALLHDDNLEFQAAEVEYMHALSLNSDYATAHQWFAAHNMMQARFDEAIGEAQRAVTLDPLSASAQAQLAGAFLLSHRYDEAIAQGRRALSLNAAYVRAHILIAEALAKKGEYGRALETVSTARSLRTDEVELDRVVGCILGTAGRRREAVALARTLAARYDASREGRPAGVASIYASMGDTQRTFEWLRRARDARDPDLAFIGVDLWFEPVRKNSRFQSLLAELQLPR
jgi:tetratricopeptide (TPR) repeat protein